MVTTVNPEFQKNPTRFLDHTAEEYDRLRKLHTGANTNNVRLDEYEINSLNQRFDEAVYAEKNKVDANLLQLTAIFTQAVHNTRNKVFQYLDTQQRIFRENIQFLRDRLRQQNQEVVNLPEFDRSEFQTRLDKTSSDDQKVELIQSKLTEISGAQRRCETRERNGRYHQHLLEKLRTSPTTFQRKNEEGYEELRTDFEAALRNISSQYHPRNLRSFEQKRCPSDYLEVRLQDYFKAGVTPALHYFQPGTTNLQIISLPDTHQGEQGLKTKKVELDTSAPNPDYHGTVTTPEGRIFILGGIDSFNNIHRRTLEYDPKTNTLHKKSDMLNERYGFGVTYAKGRIYVFGGYGRQGNVTNANEFYDVRTNTWSAIPNSQFATAQSSVVSFSSGVFYKFGGYLQDRTLYGGIERFSVHDNAWTTIVPHSDTKVPIYPLCATAQINANQVLIFGGVDEKGRGVKKSFLFSVDSWKGNDGFIKHEERITALDDSDLPTADGFWDQQTFAHQNRIYALQNVSGHNNEVVGRRVLEYAEKTWNIMTKSN